MATKDECRQISDFAAGDCVVYMAECAMKGFRVIVPEANHSSVNTVGDDALFLDNAGGRVLSHYKGSLWGDSDKWKAAE